MSNEQRVLGKFGQLLRMHRKEAKYAQEEFGVLVGVSTTSISNFERGVRIPNQAALEAMIRILKLTDEETQELFESLGHSVKVDSDAYRLLDEIWYIFGDTELTSEVRHRLVLRIKDALGAWKSGLQKSIRQAVIPVAGWQARLLAPELTAELIRLSITELRGTDIDRCIIIISKSQEKPLNEKLHELRKESYNMKIQFVVQDQQLGLGHAILTAENYFNRNDEPFVVILPDDKVKDDCINSMIKIYKEKQSCVVALRKFEESDSDNYGIVTFKEDKGNACKILHLQEIPENIELLEKKAAILGRYILNSSIFEVLRKIRPHQRSGEIELTDALQKLVQSEIVYGYMYLGERYCIAPRRIFWEDQLGKFLKV